MKNLQDARYNLVKAIQANDQHFRAKRLMVDVESELKHYSSAVCYINELLEFQPYDRDLWRRKIGLYRNMGNHVEADNALERLSHIYPNDSLVMHDLRNRYRENWNVMLQKSSTHEAADNLEQWLDVDPNNLEYYLELMNLYQRLGENDRAIGAANRGLLHFPNNSQIVHKAVGILTSMGLYSQALAFAKQHGGAGALYNGVLRDLADNARLNDPYDVTGRLYATTHDRDALTYLLNTALTRGYYDDAHVYLDESYKQSGRTAPLLMKQYSLEKRFGNDQAAYRLLQELYTLNPNDTDLGDQYADMMLELANHDITSEQWADACSHLQRVLDIMQPTNEAWPAVVSRQITVLGRLNRLADARQLYKVAAATDSQNQQRYASAYEDVVANRLKFLVDEEHYEDALKEARMLLDIVPGSEVALRCCINMTQTLKRSDDFHKYAQQGYDAFPANPYFIVKQAVSLREQGRTSEALALLHPRSEADEYVNPQLVAAFSGISQEWADELLKERMAEEALQVIDSALVHDASNRELLYSKGIAYELLKEYGKAYELQHANYNPSNAEQSEWMEHMRYLHFRSFKNRIDASYTHAVYDTREGSLGSTAHLYSIASVAYSRLMKRNTYTGQVSYKGIDGYHADGENESGGVGLEFMAQWEHTFNHRWSGMISGAYSTKYFNKYSFNISASYAADRGWTPSLRLGYRRTPETYLFLSQGSSTLYTRQKYNLFILTPSIEKSWELIKTSLAVDVSVLNSKLYYNVGLKGKLFINNDNISSVSLLTGFGSFPELSFFEQTALRGISHTNAMIGFDAQYLFTHNFYMGVAGSWNTCYNPFRMDDGSLVSSYRNIYTVTLQMHVAF
ncbi:MAG: hypothetical protein IJ139_03755 [Bacteroidaceae bacterium]|nr:hypothetical protein [Bacteroidaceae bacterium]